MTLKSLGLRFKRYDLMPDLVAKHGPNIRAILVTDQNKQNLGKYIEECDGTTIYDSEKNKLYVYEYRISKLALGGTRGKWYPAILNTGDYLIQNHRGTWLKKRKKDFEEMIK